MPEKMDHYQKLSVIMLRCIGLGLTCLGLLFAALDSYRLTPNVIFENVLKVGGAFFLYMIPGLLLFVVGGSLGRLIGRGYAERPSISGNAQDLSDTRQE